MGIINMLKNNRTIHFILKKPVYRADCGANTVPCETGYELEYMRREAEIEAVYQRRKKEW